MIDQEGHSANSPNRLGYLFLDLPLAVDEREIDFAACCMAAIVGQRIADPLLAFGIDRPRKKLELLAVGSFEHPTV